MTSTTTVDCSGKTLAPTTEHNRPEKLKKNAEKITTKHNEPQQPYFEEVLPRLDSQNCGRTTCLQGKTALL
jgi:hypothetical protein